MAGASSFDIVSRVEISELSNAVNQAMMEIGQRYDFKDSKSRITLDERANAVTIVSDDNFKLKSVVEILQSKCIKRGVPIKNLVYGKIENAAGGSVRQVISVQQGIPSEKAKDIVKTIKGTKLKIQASIQEDQVRVAGKKKDDLQTIISLLKEKDLGINLQFVNYR